MIAKCPQNLFKYTIKPPSQLDTNDIRGYVFKDCNNLITVRHKDVYESSIYFKNTH